MNTRKFPLIVLVGLGALASVTVAESPKKIAEYRGVAANTSDFGVQGIVPITFEIFSWTSQDTMNQLGDTLAKGGPDALLSALQKIDDPAAYMRTPESLAVKLRTASMTKLPDGSVNISFLTDRIVSAIAKAGGSQVANYPFELIQLVIPASGKDGKGKILRQANMTYNSKTGGFVVEEWANQPTIVNEIRTEKVN